MLRSVQRLERRGGFRPRIFETRRDHLEYQAIVRIQNDERESRQRMEPVLRRGTGAAHRLEEGPELGGGAGMEADEGDLAKEETDASVGQEDQPRAAVPGPNARLGNLDYLYPERIARELKAAEEARSALQIRYLAPTSSGQSS